MASSTPTHTTQSIDGDYDIVMKETNSQTNEGNTSQQSSQNNSQQGMNALIVTMIYFIKLCSVQG